MIPVIELAKSLRYALGDMRGENISDDELTEAINQAARQLYERFSERYVYVAVKRIPSIIIGTEEFPVYVLPSDFLRIHQVLGFTRSGIAVPIQPVSTNPPKCGTYRITGETLYAPEGEYSVEYYYLPARVETLGDNLDVPEAMRTWIEKTAIAVYKKDMATCETIALHAESVLAGREISHFEDIGPVQILGGRV